MTTRTLFIASLLALPLSTAAWSAGLPEVIDRVRPGIVGVGTAYPPRQPNPGGKTVSYLGTGFVVGNGRQVVTNAHVIPTGLDTEHNQMLAIFAGRGAAATVHPARVVRSDIEHDLALLEIQGKTLPALEIGDSSRVREGQEIAFTGFPIGMVLGLYPVTHRGIVAAIAPVARPAENARTIDPAQMHRLRNPFDVFQLDATAYPGNSGSPVYAQDSGRVIGVINSVLVKESAETLLSNPSGITYAIPAVHVQRLLRGGGSD
ncbi:MAG: serine protease [Halioglobus sp.]|nr:serine protease [Halioglobus sp.]